MYDQSKSSIRGNLQKNEIMIRVEKEKTYDERIDRYLRNQMDDTERDDFEQEVDSNQELRERLIAAAILVKGIAQERMQHEGQAQLDAIRQMSRDEFQQAISEESDRKPSAFVAKWAAVIATVAIGTGGLLYPILSRPPIPLIAENKNKIETPTKPNVVKTPARPTLASLAKEYNKGFSNEPDEFVAIRQQIERGDAQDMMAAVYDIDQIDAPQYVEGAKGAEDADAIKEAQQLFSDCAHWYKALAYLKNGDKESAIKELREVKEQGSTDELVKRASALLKKLGK